METFLGVLDFLIHYLVLILAIDGALFHFFYADRVLPLRFSKKGFFNGLFHFFLPLTARGLFNTEVCDYEVVEGCGECEDCKNLSKEI